jgi:hypothetical protein
MSSITTAGDYISLIAIMVVIEKSGFGTLNAAYGSVIKHFGIFTSAILSNYVFKFFKSKTILIGTQLLSALFSLNVIYSVKNNSATLWTLYLSIFSITVLQQLFSNTRDYISKNITEQSKQSHFHNQSSILSGLFGAQTIGPLLAFILVRNFPLYIPLGIDFLTFLIAAFIGLLLTHNQSIHSNENYLSTFNYIFKNRERCTLYLLRSVGFWFGIGLVNFLIFLIISNRFNLSVVDISIVFITQGAGAFFGNLGLKKFRNIFPSENWKICFIGHFFLGIGCLLFFMSNSFKIALIPLFFSAIGSGINMVASQTIRREVVDQNYFAHFIAAELIIGRLSNWGISSLAKISIEGGVSYEIWYFSGVGIILLTGFLHVLLQKRINLKNIISQRAFL